MPSLRPSRCTPSACGDSDAGVSPLLTSDEDIAKDLWTIGHNAVHAEVQQAMHLVRIVDRPDMHVEPTTVRPVDECLSHHRNGAGPYRHLCSPGVRPSRQSGGETSGLTWSEARAQLGADHRPDPTQARIAECADTDAVKTRGSSQCGHQFVNRPIGLAVDVDLRRRERRKQFVQQWNRFTTIDACRGHLGPWQVGNRSRPTACPLEISIMKRNEDPIGREVYISLKVCVPEGYRVFERRHRVLRVDPSSSSMCKREHSVELEKWVSGDWTRNGHLR